MALHIVVHSAYQNNHQLTKRRLHEHMAESKGKPSAPNVLHVTRETAKGRKLLFVTSTEKYIRQVASRYEAKEIETVIVAMDKEAGENTPLLTMMTAGASDLAFEVDVYEVNDKFWVWFREAVKWERMFNDALNSIVKQLKAYLKEWVPAKSVPPVTDDTERFEWEIQTVRELTKVREMAIGLEKNLELRAALTEHFSKQYLESVMLTTHVNDLGLDESSAATMPQLVGDSGEEEY